jgi:pyridinium-3,5-biscarboxylic acid mononucleotide sulfurtransferase
MLGLSGLSMDLALRKLQHCLRQTPRALLLFSGGLDSSLLLAAAAPVLGSGLTALTFTGPHTVPGELAAAFRLARRLRVPLVVREFDPLTLPDFRENSRARCYACKLALILQARDLAARRGLEVLWDGTNADDLSEFRPGLQALQEQGVVSPLLLAGLGKAAIRRLTCALGLPGDRPTQSCLATRFPYGVTLTREALARVGQAESWLHRRGFSQVRLRVLADGAARLELRPEEWPAFLAPGLRGRFHALGQRLGWKRLELDASLK